MKSLAPSVFLTFNFGLKISHKTSNNNNENLGIRIEIRKLLWTVSRSPPGRKKSMVWAVWGRAAVGSDPSTCYILQLSLFLLSVSVFGGYIFLPGFVSVLYFMRPIKITYVYIILFPLGVWFLPFAGFCVLKKLHPAAISHDVHIHFARLLVEKVINECNAPCPWYTHDVLHSSQLQ